MRRCDTEATRFDAGRYEWTLTSQYAGLSSRAPAFIDRVPRISLSAQQKQKGSLSRG